MEMMWIQKKEGITCDRNVIVEIRGTAGLFHCSEKINPATEITRRDVKPSTINLAEE